MTGAPSTYVVVSMTVTNTGNRSQGYYGDNQKLVDNSGRQFSPDSLSRAKQNVQHADVKLLRIIHLSSLPATIRTQALEAGNAQ